MNICHLGDGEIKAQAAQIQKVSDRLAASQAAPPMLARSGSSGQPHPSESESGAGDSNRAEIAAGGAGRFGPGTAVGVANNRVIEEIISEGQNGSTGNETLKPSRSRVVRSSSLFVERYGLLDFPGGAQNANLARAIPHPAFCVAERMIKTLRADVVRLHTRRLVNLPPVSIWSNVNNRDLKEVHKN